MTDKAIDDCIEMLEAKSEPTRTRFDKSKSLYVTAFKKWPSDDIGLQVVSEAVFLAEGFPDVSNLQQRYRDAIMELSEEEHNRIKSEWSKASLSKVANQPRPHMRRAMAEGFYDTKQLSAEVEEWISATDNRRFPGFSKGMGISKQYPDFMGRKFKGVEYK